MKNAIKTDPAPTDHGLTVDQMNAILAKNPARTEWPQPKLSLWGQLRLALFLLKKKPPVHIPAGLKAGFYNGGKCWFVDRSVQIRVFDRNQLDGARRARQWCNYNAVAQCRTGGMGLLLSDEQFALADELDALHHDWSSLYGLDHDQLDEALKSLRPTGKARRP
jgi:hypothetical protein